MVSGKNIARLCWAILAAGLILAGCGTEAKIPAEKETKPAAAEAVQKETGETEKQEETVMIKLTVGSSEIFAILEDNPTAAELKELLKSGPITMEAYNYGGFEKVCSLGESLTANNVQVTTQAGDIMLYNSDKIVIFYGSNSWAYTSLAKVADEYIPLLKNVLSGSENEVIIDLAKKHS